MKAELAIFSYRLTLACSNDIIVYWDFFVIFFLEKDKICRKK
jgi:hypothetical protein